MPTRNLLKCAISENISFYEVVQILSKLEEEKVIKKRASGYLQ